MPLSDLIIPHSGGENAQLKNYDATNRVVASPTGGTRTADILNRDPSGIGIRPWQATGSEMPPRVKESGNTLKPHVKWHRQPRYKVK